MNRNTLIGTAVGLVVGILVGYIIGSSRTPERPIAPAPVAPASPFPLAPLPGAPGGELPARIAQTEQLVARDPKNAQAWVQLGNDYFDLAKSTNDPTQQRKSVAAYDHALAIAPNNPDVLTDQGVMYRDLGEYQKAIANFQKANQVDPNHVQSLFNLGVVYAQDLKQPDKAIAAFNRVVEISPGSPQAAQAKQLIDSLKRSGK